MEIEYQINKYIEGKIYKITSKNTDQFYIGSTCSSLKHRFYSHIKGYEFYCHNKDSAYHLSSYDIIKFGDAVIELIEEFPCQSRNELEIQFEKDIFKN